MHLFTPSCRQRFVSRLSDFVSVSAVCSVVSRSALRPTYAVFPPRRKHLGRELIWEKPRRSLPPSLPPSLALPPSAVACRRRWWAGGLPRQPLSLTEGRLTASAEEAAERVWVHLSPQIALFSLLFSFLQGK